MSAVEWTAQWPFDCACCGGRYPAGTVAKYAGDGSKVAVDCDGRGLAEGSDAPYVLGDNTIRESHDYIPTDKEMAEARSKMCQSCFLVHAGECA